MTPYRGASKDSNQGVLYRNSEIAISKEHIVHHGYAYERARIVSWKHGGETPASLGARVVMGIYFVAFAVFGLVTSRTDQTALRVALPLLALAGLGFAFDAWRTLHAAPLRTLIVHVLRGASTKPIALQIVARDRHEYERLELALEAALGPAEAPPNDGL